ncbi:hypothetical protein FRC09_017789 [Ceratobasidium sp. 395]|nr:hypothetical protein FRC09_017789 [Ceratobasidium sp. 395]
MDSTDDKRGHNTPGRGPQVPAGTPTTTTMRDWMTDTEDLTSLVIVTDICKCTNIFELPYMAERGNNGVWKWTRTEYFSEDNLDRWSGTRMLHFASTNQGEDAQETTSAGGIYTRGFSDVWPYEQVTLARRLDEIQDHMNTFFHQLSELEGKPCLKQRHRLYSSYQPSFTDTNAFEALGICRAG